MEPPRCPLGRPGDLPGAPEPQAEPVDRPQDARRPGPTSSAHASPLPWPYEPLYATRCEPVSVMQPEHEGHLAELPQALGSERLHS